LAFTDEIVDMFLSHDDNPMYAVWIIWMWHSTF